MRLLAGSINLLVCRVPVGTHQYLLIITALRHERCCSRSVATPFMACTVLFISHPFGVINKSPLLPFAATIVPPPRVPFFRGVRRSRGVCIGNQIPKVLISGRDICAGSASGIHTPPLSWHPFRKGTLPPCRLYPQSVSIASDRRAATARPLF